MKRKVIQIAESTQLVSLPRKWALKHKIAKGEELEVCEQGNRIVISTDSDLDLGDIEFNVKDFDSQSIQLYIRGAYKKGYDTIKLNFDDPSAKDPSGKAKNIISIIKEELNRCIGLEIVQQRDSHCVVKKITKSSIDEFDTVLKRIFSLILDGNADLLHCIKSNDKAMLETMNDKYETITKFVNYCTRLLNRKGYTDYKQTSFIADVVKNLGKISELFSRIPNQTLKLGSISKESINIIELLSDSIHLYNSLFYKFDPSTVTKISANGAKIRGMISEFSAPRNEFALIYCVSHISDTLSDLTESTVALYN